MQTIAYKRESELLNPVRNYMASQGFRYQATEVPLFDHSIDLFTYSALMDQSIAVELKLRNWPRAFRQALLYQLCCDRSYIAVPCQTARRVDMDLLTRFGIGVYSISNDGTCEEIVEARVVGVGKSYYRDDYARMMLEQLDEQ